MRARYRCSASAMTSLAASQPKYMQTAMSGPAVKSSLSRVTGSLACNRYDAIRSLCSLMPGLTVWFAGDQTEGGAPRRYLRLVARCP